MEGEEKWLSNLEKTLADGEKKGSTDAEEISEELDVSNDSSYW
jgi:hypothetical protein